jgi:transposase-like protein
VPTKPIPIIRVVINGTQNYRCKDCGHEMTCRGCLSRVVSLVKTMLVRGTGIRDTGAVLNISVTKVLNVLESSEYTIKPKKTPYDCLETDEFWAYVGKKRTKCG